MRRSLMTMTIALALGCVSLPAGAAGVTSKPPFDKASATKACDLQSSTNLAVGRGSCSLTASAQRNGAISLSARATTPGQGSYPSNVWANATARVSDVTRTNGGKRVQVAAVLRVSSASSARAVSSLQDRLDLSSGSSVIAHVVASVYACRCNGYGKATIVSAPTGKRTVKNKDIIIRFWISNDAGGKVSSGLAAFSLSVYALSIVGEEDHEYPAERKQTTPDTGEASAGLVATLRSVTFG